jgi:hypothetical protein
VSRGVGMAAVNGPTQTVAAVQRTAGTAASDYE